MKADWIPSNSRTSLGGSAVFQVGGCHVARVELDSHKDYLALCQVIRAAERMGAEHERSHLQAALTIIGEKA